MTSMLDDLRLLRSLFTADTTELPDTWNKYKPSTGHCHVASIIIYRNWGGRILTGMTHVDAPTWSRHYWNDLDGITLDVTRDQFRDRTNFIQVMDATGEDLNIVTQVKLELLERRFDEARKRVRLPA